MTHSVTLSDRQRRALAEMRIDVWIRRAPGAAAPTLLPASVAESMQKNPAPPPTLVSSSAQPFTEAAPTIQLDCLAAPGVVLVGEFANASDRRFAQDIALALAGMGATVAATQFRWPQTQTGDTSQAASDSAYMGFLRGQTDRAAARCLLLFGAAAAALDASISNNECSVLRLADIALLRGDAAGKKALWLTISHLVRG